jgi:hypothetical protein
MAIRVCRSSSDVRMSLGERRNSSLHVRRFGGHYCISLARCCSPSSESGGNAEQHRYCGCAPHRMTSARMRRRSRSPKRCASLRRQEVGGLEETTPALIADRVLGSEGRCRELNTPRPGARLQRPFDRSANPLAARRTPRYLYACSIVIYVGVGWALPLRRWWNLQPCGVYCCYTKP